MIASESKLSFEEALNRTGFGLYSFLITCLSGLVIISLACVAYGTTVIIPTSACELETTGAQRGALAAVPVVGLILGAVVWGYLADVFGRKPTLLISLISAAAVNALASISVNWIMLMFLQFIATILAAGQYSLVMTLLSESVPMVKRNMLVLLVTSIFLLSQGIMSVLAIPIIPLTFSYHLTNLGIYWNSWRTLMVVYSLPSLLSAVWLCFMHESPKFLFAKGREMEALTVLRSIHKMNIRTGESLKVDGIMLDDLQKSGPTTVKQQIVPIFKPPLLKNTILITLLFVFQQVGAFMVWLPTIANQFSQILESGEGTNFTLCGILQSAINTPPDPDAVPCALNITALLIVLGVVSVQSVLNIFLSMIIDRVGRRNMVIAVTGVCGILGIIVNLIPNAIGSAVVFCGFLVGLVVMGLYTAIVVASYPTYLRALAMAFTTTGSRISTFASIQILNFLLENNCEVGFYLFSAIFASSAVVAFFLVNDRVPRPKTVQHTRM